jgi:hypothetical protein
MVRTNKSKEELIKEAEHRKVVMHKKDVVKLVFAELQDQKSIYDSQTLILTMAGLIAQELRKRNDEMVLDAIDLDFDAIKDDVFKAKLIALANLLYEEKGQELADLLQELADAFGKLGAHRFVQGKMDQVKIDDLI